MNNQVEKKTALYFRWMLVVWVLIMNAVLLSMNFSYGWLIFISNIMMFTMEGQFKDRFWSVEIGGLVGLLCTVAMLLVYTAIAPAVGNVLGVLIPLAVILIVLIVLHPYAPKVLNNVGFAYLTCACIDSTAFASNIGLFIAAFVVGSVIFNLVSIALMKPASALAKKRVASEEGSAAQPQP